MNRRTTALLTATAVVALTAGTAGTPAVAAASLTKRKVEKIAARVVERTAPRLEVARAVRATTADRAVSAADSALLGGAGPDAYRNRVILLNGTHLSTDGQVTSARWTIHDVPDGDYLMTYSLSFDQSVPGAEIVCRVGFSNPVSSGTIAGRASGTNGIVNGTATALRRGAQEPQLTCGVSEGTFATAPPRFYQSTVTLLRIDDVATASTSVERIE